MRAFLTYLSLTLLLLVLLATPAEAVWGKRGKGQKKKDTGAQQPSGKQSAEVGLQAFQELCKWRDRMARTGGVCGACRLLCPMD